ncbi:MAG: DEAD/DEAH box helicase [Epulopiscium sp.]|nr:DEAD/DEAH box helicase [Candidatus Epulonipiscium sp.]
MSNIKFNELGLERNILRAIEDMGFDTPSPIQAEVIPVALKGYDMIGQAQTGTGKTLAFGAPILNQLGQAERRSKGMISCLILAPTRELAIQVNEELQRIAKYTETRVVPVYGGQPIINQIKALKKDTDIVVGTPGRVLDLMKRKVIRLANVRFLVLDEADEMLNMGFIEDIETIIKGCSEDRQTLLFSATMPAQIKRLAKRYMKAETKHITVVQDKMTVDTVSQYYYEVRPGTRFETLCRILDVEEPTTAMIFCKTKRGVDEVVEGMQERGYNVEGMHGDMNQSQRLNTLRKFKEGTLEILVATDVAARGIDVDDVSHVINYDLPQDVESYVHRIGRTGRANKKGKAYTLVTSREYMVLKQTEKVTKSRIERKEIPTLEEIFEAKHKKMLPDIEKTLSSNSYQRFIPFVENMAKELDLVDVSAALMEMLYRKDVSFEYTQNDIGSSSSYVRLFLTVGRMDRLTAKELLQFFNSTAKVNREDIGEIDILEKFTFVDATEPAAKSILKHCQGKKIGRRKVKIEISQNRKRK